MIALTSKKRKKNSWLCQGSERKDVVNLKNVFALLKLHLTAKATRVQDIG